MKLAAFAPPLRLLFTRIDFCSGAIRTTPPCSRTPEGGSATATRITGCLAPVGARVVGHHTASRTSLGRAAPRVSSRAGYAKSVEAIFSSPRISVQRAEREETGAQG